MDASPFPVCVHVEPVPVVELTDTADVWRSTATELAEPEEPHIVRGYD